MEWASRQLQVNLQRYSDVYEREKGKSSQYENVVLRWGHSPVHFTTRLR